MIPLTILTATYTVEVEAGRDASLPCNATGTLEPIVTWTSPSGNVILSGQNYNFDQITGKYRYFVNLFQ